MPQMTNEHRISWTRLPGVSRRRLLASAGATALAAGCGSRPGPPASRGSSSGSGAQGGVKRGGSLTTVANSGAIPGQDFDVHGATANATNIQPLFAVIHSSLIRLKVGGDYKYTDRTVEGALAAKWEQPDSQTVVFHLRPEAKFHNKPPVNGRAVSANDVKFTFERMFASPFAYANFYNSVATIDAPDPQTAVMKLKSPDAALLAHLSLGFAWIIPKEAGKADPKSPAGLDFKDLTSAIGAGPFMADSYDRGTKAVFVRNPDYWEQGLPYLDRVEFLFLTDPAPQLAALQTGQVALGRLPIGSEAEFKGRNPKLTYSAVYDPLINFKAMRTDKPPFNDPRVRHALSMTFNQADFTKAWGTPDAPQSYGSLTANSGDAYLPLDKLGEDGQWWRLDLNAAKGLMAAAGYANGFSADYNSAPDVDLRELPELWAAQLAQMGVKINIKLQEHAPYAATVARGQYEGTAGSASAVFDPDDWFSLVLAPGAPRNASHVDDKTVNDLTAKQKAELDPLKRLDLIHQAVKYLAGQVYYLVDPQVTVTETRQAYLKNYAPRIGYQPTLAITWLDR
ncbi:MAG TPA: ABC transporter substrate-binding protein [Dehalococcoidia bacterium]|nr:ABC transporter substrate-binding protein [Dehalococcoidia bacterium]